ncbi:ATP synthase subunit a [Candidatus Xiphinematobacter sp. Idaho Grape]|uniref:F0F1 ATP synthase subunit A n=1 Tax=Candidatus Xiphinematobacter sp. Idaho Grape TaxID=1704307 RepID=UPI000705797B|nr:F0F1 ATP synthase subunit A [Candidatus Xiphinematobacter sp. Idaho Grape]ALJ56491.1 ATP synthase subunit a [Candidatus Xiphinematobacter sp. Idaho Grape]
MTFYAPVLVATFPLKAESAYRFFPTESLSFTAWLSNSILVSVLVTGAVLLFAYRFATRLRVIPGGMQNFFEAIVEITLNVIEGIIGRRMAQKAFGFLASLFLFILFSNWFGLLPGVGTVGWGSKAGFLTVSEVEIPLLRPTTADLNMTLGLATVAMYFWFLWTVQEVGFFGLVKALFEVKGGVKGVLSLVLSPIFLFVGVLEVISILVRPMSLSLRLYGNVYAGEILMRTMTDLGNSLGFSQWVSALMSVVVPIPFYFLELLIGFLQAVVFTLLIAVYIQLSTVHSE